MVGENHLNFAKIYAGFEAPISVLDCGEKCAPYNENGVPFCCDTHHAVPAVYADEWQYLQENTDLWHLWAPEEKNEFDRVRRETPEPMHLVECLGHRLCQRGYRSVACRAFPFFPYLTSENEFVGLSYYWEYENACWVINHLDCVSTDYRQQFIETFDRIFAVMPDERRTYGRQSLRMRRIFARQGRSIPLLHRDGAVYKLSPRTGRMRLVSPDVLAKYGPYKIARLLPFPDEQRY
jgi:hypothetical protein